MFHHHSRAVCDSVLTRSLWVLVLTMVMLGSSSLSSSRRLLYSRGVFNAPTAVGGGCCSCRVGMNLVLLCMLAFTCSIFCMAGNRLQSARELIGYQRCDVLFALCNPVLTQGKICGCLKCGTHTKASTMAHTAYSSEECQPTSV